MAVTVTYLTAPAGIVAPTAAQALNLARVSADIIAAADADTTATVTHSFGLSATQLADGDLIVIPVNILQVAGSLSLWAITSHATNTAVATKATTGGSGVAGAQLRVHCIRHSYIGMITP